MGTVLMAIALPLCAYLVGSIPFGLLFVRMRVHDDIRRMGSGNIGATNVKRALGTRWAILTLACDALKGGLPTLAALSLFGTPYLWLPALTALAAVIGHIYPIYLGFKPSGKGVATTLGGLMIIAPLVCLICLVVFILAVFISRRVSVGSLLANFILPTAAWFITVDPAVCAATIAIMALIFSRHRENMERLVRGTEPKIRFKNHRP